MFLAEKRAHEGPVYERLLKDDAKARLLLEIKQEEALIRELETLKVGTMMMTPKGTMRSTVSLGNQN